MNHYEAFNDPFECRCEIIEGFPIKDPNDLRFRNIVKAWGFDDPNSDLVSDNYDEYVLELEDTEPSIPLILDSARISCFSRKNDNLLMWAHYANGLRGFCIEFDPKYLMANASEFTKLYDVLYEDTPSVIDTALIAVLNDQVDYHNDAIYATETQSKYYRGDWAAEIEMYKDAMERAYRQNDEIYQKMLATKPLEWKYEEEIRIITQTEKTDKSGVTLKYPPEAIKSIILGEKMTPNHSQTIINIAKGYPTPIEIKKASRAPGKFDIVINTKI